MDTRLEAKFIECLSALDQGEAIDQILARYPDDAAKLRPLLITAQSIPALRMEPSEAVKMKSRDAFLQQAAALRQSKRRVIGFVPRFVTSLTAAIVIIAIVGVGAIAASGSALPGDPLYGLKRTIETARLALSPDILSRGALAAQFDQTRVSEVKALITASRSTHVEFGGTIESIQNNTWLVAGITVLLNSSTSVTGTPLTRSRAQVIGTSSSNGVAATSITIDANTPAPTPTPAPSPTIEPTPTPIVTPTLTITPTQPITPTIAPTPTPIEVEFSGVVQTIGVQSWTINGTLVQVTSSTQIESGIGIGQNVSVKAVQHSGGQLVAIQISKIVEPDTGGGDSPPTQEPAEPGATDKPEPTEIREPTESPEPTEQPEPTETPHD
ncbi:MAG TPA: DUF5666 domain-containing protein [Anaerolineae bacterium]|nr:DUF5666 domain-containing protein [Anaerolineae bacterium]